MFVGNSILIKAFHDIKARHPEATEDKISCDGDSLSAALTFPEGSIVRVTSRGRSSTLFLGVCWASDQHTTLPLCSASGEEVTLAADPAEQVREVLSEKEGVPAERRDEAEDLANEIIRLCATYLPEPFSGRNVSVVVDYRRLNWCHGLIQVAQQKYDFGDEEGGFEILQEVKDVLYRAIQGPGFDPEGREVGRLEIDPKTGRGTFVPRGEQVQPEDL